MKYIDTKKIEDTVYELALEACRTLIPSCKTALKEALAQEDNPTAAFALSTVLENAQIAKEEALPVCQDTGMSVVLVELGQDVVLTGKPLNHAINDGVRRAYADGYFRKSICDPITRVNTGDNTPAAIHLTMIEGEKVEITFLPKGFGSENMSKLYMLTPAKGVEGILESIVATVREAGSKPCPPVYVGVGIGGSFDTCAFLAKKALCRPVGSRNPRDDVHDIETEALRRINALGIGAQGFHGKTTALGVSCEIAPTHIAGLPVAVNIQCHCVRCAKAVIL